MFRKAAGGATMPSCGVTSEPLASLDPAVRGRGARRALDQLVALRQSCSFERRFSLSKADVVDFKPDIPLKEVERSRARCEPPALAFPVPTSFPTTLSRSQQLVPRRRRGGEPGRWGACAAL